MVQKPKLNLKLESLVWKIKPTGLKDSDRPRPPYIVELDSKNIADAMIEWFKIGKRYNQCQQ